MTEFNHQKLMDAFAALGDAAITYVTETFPAVTVTAPKTYGERMQEMEWEIHRLQADNAELQDKLDTEQEDRRDQLRAILIGHGLGIDDDTTDELLQALSTELTALSTLRTRVKYQQDRLDTRDTNVAAAEELAAIRAVITKTPTQTFLIDDSGDIDYVSTIEHMVRVLTGRDERVNAELIELRTRNQRQFADLTAARQELTNLRNTHHEWVNGQRTKEPTLSESIQRINDVVTMQIEMLSPTSGTGKVVDIRRRRLAEHSVEHDAEHAVNGDQLRRAANALLDSAPANWPWDEGSWATANEEPLLHACALFIAHYDAIRKAMK